MAKEKPSVALPKQVKNRRFRSCWLCQKEDHLSYQCSAIPKNLQEKLKRQGLVCAKAVKRADRQTSVKNKQA